ncbi:MAG: hypothetical protein ABGY43_10495 [bacterium]
MGIVSVGIVSVGIVSVGIVSVGIVSVGIVSVDVGVAGQVVTEWDTGLGSGARPPGLGSCTHTGFVSLDFRCFKHT